jgi:hypothetical protein
VSDITEANAQEMKRIKDAAVKNGTFMKAPNGEPTRLDERQWLQVRTKAFKRWFGDWENDVKNASKAVDMNGEPEVFIHQTNNFFTAFRDGFGSHGRGIYFLPRPRRRNITPLQWYGKINMYVFLNIRKPIERERNTEHHIGSIQTDAFLRENGFDGVILSLEDFGETVVFNPN